MTDKYYRITIEADFIYKASEPEEIRRKLRHLLKDLDWEEKNFESGIERVKEVDVQNISQKEKPQNQDEITNLFDRLGKKKKGGKSEQRKKTRTKKKG